VISTANKRRKVLKNSLKEIFPEEKLDKFFLKYGIPKDTRPERLPLAAFSNLAHGRHDPTMALDDSVNHGQPHSCPPRRILRGKKTDRRCG
jgi:hypothetical protein